MKAVFAVCLISMFLTGLALSTVAHAADIPAPLLSDPKYSFLSTQPGDNFTLMYNPEKVGRLSSLVEETLLVYDGLSRFFGDYPDRTTIVVAGDNSEFRLLINVAEAPDSVKAMNWNDGYNGLVVIKSPSMLPDFRQVLAHELAHIACRTRLTRYKSMPEWFLDGLASYSAGDIVQEQRDAAMLAAINEAWPVPGDLERAYRNMTIYNRDEPEFSKARAISATLVEFIGYMYGNRSLTGILDDYAASGDLNSSFTNRTGFVPEALGLNFKNALVDSAEGPAGGPGGEDPATVTPPPVAQPDPTATPQPPEASATPAPSGTADLILPGALIAFNAIILVCLLLILRRNWH